MKIFRTNAVCPVCGKLLCTSDIWQYPFYCTKCDEDYFTSQVNDVAGAQFTISFPIPAELYKAVYSEVQTMKHQGNESTIKYDRENSSMVVYLDYYKKGNRLILPSRLVILNMVDNISRIMLNLK